MEKPPSPSLQLSSQPSQPSQPSQQSQPSQPSQQSVHKVHNDTDKNVCRLPIFKTNELKHFRFTSDQYILLEMEFTRYTIYKDIVKAIEGLFKLSANSQENSSRKIYENKNIIDRFVLECINQGISPHSSHLTMLDPDKIMELPEMDLLNRYLLFNNILADDAKIRETLYFKKMISEYIEKRFRYTPDKSILISKIFSTAHCRFARMVNELYANRTRQGYFTNIPCNLLVTSSDNYVIRYRTYSKAVNYNRYARLIRNYTRPFPFDILRMILRYAIFDLSNQQWSIGISLYEEIAHQMEIEFEMFASPLNFNMNMFCSLFLDTDKVFGSVGSFYNINVDKLLNMGLHGVFYNPPYLPLLMSTTTKMCLALLDKLQAIGKDFTIVSFLPNWSDADYIQTFLTSKYTVFQRMIPKGQYVLHEKDKGKLIKGTFDLLFIVMNSKSDAWDNSRINETLNVCENIVQLMKTEIMEKNIL